MEEILIAPCGMNCGMCASYLARAYDIKSKGIRNPYCTGCRPRDKKCAYLKKSCSPLLTGSITYCFECPGFPCNHLRTIDTRYKARYHMSMIENLEYLQKHGIAALLAREEKKWKCPDCGGVISCHNGICYNCGLEKLKNKKKFYMWDDD